MQEQCIGVYNGCSFGAAPDMSIVRRVHIEGVEGYNISVGELR